MCGSKVLFLIKKPAGIEELFQRKPAFLMPLPEFGFGWVLLLDVAGLIWNAFGVKPFLGLLAGSAFGVAKKDHGGVPPVVGYLSCFAVRSIMRHCGLENNGVRSNAAFICISAAAKPFRKPGRQSAPGHGWGSIPAVALPSAQAVLG